MESSLIYDQAGTISSPECALKFLDLGFLMNMQQSVRWIAHGVIVALGLISCSGMGLATSIENSRIPFASQTNIAQAGESTEADQLFEEATRLFQEGTASSRQQSIDMFGRAQQQYQISGNRVREATTLTIIGLIYSGLGDRQQALTFFNRALPLFQAVGDRAEEAATLRNIGIIYFGWGNGQQALTFFNRALPLVQAIGDRDGEAITLNGIGLVYSGLGDRQQALTFFNRALLLVQATGDRDGEAITLTNISSEYFTLGNRQKALTFLNRALLLFQAVGNRGGEATTLNNIGQVYSGLGDRQQALTFLNRALSLHQSIGSRGGEANTLNSIGQVYFGLGDRQQALTFFNRALPLHQTTGNRAGEASALNNIGHIYFALGEQQQAITFYNQALSLSRTIGNRDGEATTLNNIGHIYSDLNDGQQALTFYHQALSLHRTTGNRDGEAATLGGIGGVYSNLGDGQQALTFYNQALSLRRTIGDRVGEAATLNSIGVVYYDLGEQQQALTFFNQALPLNQAVGDRNGEAATLNNIGLVYDDLGRQQQALASYSQALLLSQAVGNQSGEVIVQGNLAGFYRQQGNLAMALNHIESSITRIERLRTNIGSNNDLRTSYFASVQDYYQLKIDLLMQLGREEEAFETSEAARARTLLELLGESRANIRQDVDPKLLDQERSLQLALENIEGQRIRLLSGDHSSEDARQLDQQSDDLLSQLNQLLTQIRAVSPAYADLVQPKPLTLSQIQQQVLDQDTVLVQYALGNDQSYLWIVSPTHFQSYTLPGRADLENENGAIATFLNATSTSGNSTRDVKRTGDAARSLILPDLPPWTVGKRLLIVADGILQDLPFAALPQLNQTQYIPLLADHEVLHQPSASAISVLRQQLQGRVLAPKTLAVLADPVYRPDDERVTGQSSVAPLPIELERLLRDLDLRAIQRLPYTRKEADRILALVPPSERIEAVDFAANEDWLTNSQLSQYRIVHLATHGFINPTNPQLSGLVLTMVNQQGGPLEDGFLRLHDIFNLRLPAELVVLSACQTGRGESVRGEGVIGLSRGLMYAGARRTMVSLWSVNDSATATLMEHVYRSMLQEDMSPAAALRVAQMEMVKAGQSPYLWAAFTVQGEWQP